MYLLQSQYPLRIEGLIKSRDHIRMKAEEGDPRSNGNLSAHCLILDETDRSSEPCKEDQALHSPKRFLNKRWVFEINV